MPNQDVQILLVEDDEVDVRAIRRGFQRHGIANPTVVAEDGMEALEILRGENGREKLRQPYIILLDINMPRMNGLEFLTEIRRDRDLKDSVVFVLTTSDDDRDMVAAYGNGVAGYLLKSAAGEDFIHLVRLLEEFVLMVLLPHEG